MRRIAAGVLLAGCTLVAGACGLGDKAALEETITGAPARLDDQVVVGTITVETRFVSAPAGGGAGAGGFGGAAGGDAPEIPEGGFALGEESRTFVLDLGSSHASLAVTDASPSVIWDDLVAYGRRGGIPEDDARPWVRFDLDDVGEGAGELSPLRGEGATAIVALHPAVIVDLVAGTLTGSIETVGAETIDGVETTHYAVNIAIEKALEDVRRSRYPEDRRELVERLIELLGVDGDVHAADVWLDADGGLRRFSVSLVQKPVTKVEFALVVTLDISGDITDATGSGVPTPPTPEQVLSVDSVVRFITTVTGGGAEEDVIPPSIAATLGTVPAAPSENPDSSDGPVDAESPGDADAGPADGTT